MASGFTTHEPEGPSADAASEWLPRSQVLRQQLLDAVILGAAVVCRGQFRVHPAVRMLLLREVHGCGLAGTPPRIDVLARFDTWLAATKEPTRARRLLARGMDPFVGSPWSETVLRIAEAVAGASGPASAQALMALNQLRLSLGQCGAPDCGSRI